MTIQLVDRQTGEVTFDGKRVSRSFPCPICSHLHTRQGWCVVDAQRGLAICPRVESPKRIGEAGWLHGAQIPTGSFVVRSALREERVDWTQAWAQAVADCTDSDKARLAESLGVVVDTVDIGMVDGSWAVAMWGSDDQICGIKLRTTAGKKICVTGSRLGLIIPRTYDRSLPDLFITEGESDCIVCSHFGFNTIGRTGCRSSVQQIVDRSRGKNVVIVADKDEAGQTGANALKSAIGRMARSCFVVTPNAKDLRSWYLTGATKQDLLWRTKSVRGW